MAISRSVSLVLATMFVGSFVVFIAFELTRNEQGASVAQKRSLPVALGDVALGTESISSFHSSESGLGSLKRINPVDDLKRCPEVLQGWAGNGDWSKLRTHIETGNIPLMQVCGGVKFPRGIVTSCDRTRLRYLTLAIASIRRTGCTLPMLVTFKQGELNEAEIQKILDFDSMTFVINLSLVFPGVPMPTYSIKAFALLVAPFEETISIDVDAVFLKSPELIIPMLRRNDTVALFTRDRTIGAGKDLGPRSMAFVRKLVGPNPSESMEKTRIWRGITAFEIESGLFVMTRKKCWRAIVALALMNSDRQSVAKLAFNGNGECVGYLIAMEWAKLPWGFTPSKCGVLGVSEPYRNSDGWYGNIARDDPKTMMCSIQLAHSLEDSMDAPLWWWNGAIAIRKKINMRAAPMTQYVFDKWDYEVGSWGLIAKNWRWCLQLQPKEAHALNEEELAQIEYFRQVWDGKTAM